MAERSRFWPPPEYNDFGRLSPALLGSALLFTLAFGCGLASNFLSNCTSSTTTTPEELMDATKIMKVKQPTSRVNKLISIAESTFLATVAEVAAGIATSG